MRKILLLVALVLSGCASVAPQRAEYTSLPPLEKGWSRIFFGAGQMEGVLHVNLRHRTTTGPVYINGQKVGSPAYKEYIAVDLLPGTYESNWIPDEPEKFYSSKTAITIKSGETRYFSCDMGPKGSGHYLGLIGGLINAASDYMWVGLLTEQPPFDNTSKLASYSKFTGSSNSNPPENVANHPNVDATPVANESVSQKLRDLQALRKDGVITEDEFQKKKQQLLEKL